MREGINPGLVNGLSELHGYYFFFLAVAFFFAGAFFLAFDAAFFTFFFAGITGLLNERLVFLSYPSHHRHLPSTATHHQYGPDCMVRFSPGQQENAILEIFF